MISCFFLFFGNICRFQGEFSCFGGISINIACPLCACLVARNRSGSAMFHDGFNSFTPLEQALNPRRANISTLSPPVCSTARDCSRSLVTDNVRSATCHDMPEFIQSITHVTRVSTEQSLYVRSNKHFSCWGSSSKNIHLFIQKVFVC